ILRVQLDGKRVLSQERLLEKQYGRIREVAEAPDGTIYFSTSQHDPPEGKPRPEYDQILRLVPTK
ncbi:MAG: PQQ-dependent sugar dehydrogenase, partial [Telluria sp.]